MDKLAQTIAAALRVLNPEGKEPVEDTPVAAEPHRGNCDKSADNRGKIPPRPA